MAAINDIYQISVGCQWGNQAGVNVTHWKVIAVGGAGQSDAQIASHFDTQFSTVYKSLLSNNAEYRGVKIQKVRPTPMGHPFTHVSSTGVGTGGAASMAPFTCGVLSLKTAYAGRQFQGRIYPPFPSEQDNVDTSGRPSAAYITSLNALGLILKTVQGIGPGADFVSMQCGVYSRKTASWNAVTSTISRDKWGAQRRRGDFGRTNTSGPF